MGDIEENIVDLYYEKLHSTTNPGLVLAQFFGSVFDRTITRSEIILFNRLLKVYGRFIVFFTVLDMSSMNDINFDSLYPLLSYFAKKRLDQKFGVVMMESQDLNKVANSLEKQIEKQKKQKLVIPELDT